MKRFSLAIALTLICFTLFSQQTSFGFFGGPNFSDLRFKHNLDITQNTSIQPGYILGLNVAHFFNHHIGLRAELFFEQKNTEYCTSFVYPDGASFGPTTFFPPVNVFESDNENCNDFRFSYIGIPLLLQLKTGKKIAYMLQVGPSFGFRIDQSNNYTTENDLSKFTYSLAGGAGLIIPLVENISIQFNARINYGLNDLLKENGATLKHIDYYGTVGLQKSIN